MVAKGDTKGDSDGRVLDVDLNAFENMGSKMEAGQKKAIAFVELVDISGIKDGSGGVSTGAKNFQEEEKFIGKMNNRLEN
jgi:hypothetical protein